MTVSIKVDIDWDPEEIAGLKGALESLDDDLDFDLGLDGDLGDTLDDLSDSLDELSEGLSSDLDNAAKRLENVEIDGVTTGGGDSGGDTGSDSGDRHVPSSRQFFSGGVFKDDSNTPHSLKQALDRFNQQAEDVRGFETLSQSGFGERSETQRANARMRRMWQRAAIQKGDFSLLGGRGGGGGGGTRRLGSLNKISKLTGKDGHLSKMNRGFKRLIPNMRTWWRLIGVAIPALGALAVQALGVASAMGAMAVAGAGLVGLGLLGHGDTMAESMKNAKEQLQTLKKDLFDTFQPTMQLFAPVQDAFFDFIPGQLKRVARSMDGLLVYKDDIFGLFRGLTQFTADFIDVIADSHKQVSQLTARFGQLLGSSIIDLFSGLIDEASKNQDMLVNLGVSFKELALGLYEMFLMVARTITMLGPFFNVLGSLAKLLNNRLFSGVLAIVAALYMMTAAGMKVIGVLSFIGTILSTVTIPLLSTLFTWIQAYIFGALQATAVSYGLAHSIASVAAALGTLLSMSGIGLILAGTGILGGKKAMDSASQGIGGSGSGSGSGTTNNYYEGDQVQVDIQGDAGKGTVERFKDMESWKHVRDTRSPGGVSGSPSN